ncbi:D-lactate dehydrogenase [Starmerella bacillaris]|uniref:D-2-hydroxyglutarate dehydrogenase, mitochondrial n=1 Tax=Starmerella bacillaris TaxID=1247836 RepID=A0AAV5RFH2_STABA|nr:D-lactate dehydrogenase [Starmerella bacillaris]
MFRLAQRIKFSGLAPSRSVRSLFTADKYPVKRGNYSELNAEDIKYFESFLNSKDLLTDKKDLDAVNVDWMQKYRGQSKLLLKPRSVSEVSKILKHCHDRKLAVVPQGGNTGLVGGSVPVFDEIVISLANLNKIRKFDDVSGTLTVDAGVILQTADEWLRERGYIFPLDLGAKGSCQIGGNVATNAGGLRLLRYGSLHGTVLGIEAVLPNGDIFNGLSTLRKDNTGLDLKQLFIGSEGSIGIITGVSVLCPPKSNSVNVAWLGLDSYEAVQKTFKLAKNALGEILSSFECVDRASMEVVDAALKKHDMEAQQPLESMHPYQILIETSGSNSEHDEQKLNAFLENSMENELVVDGVVAQDEGQIQALWQWREGISESSGKWGGVYKYDVSLPLPVMWDLVKAVENRLIERNLQSKTDSTKPVYATIGYGHIGDGNLHLNVCVREYTKEVEDVLEPFVFEFIAKHNGSVSAEHGVGFQKVHALQYSKDAGALKLIKEVKNMFDPHGIMNPYKFIE